MFFSQLRFRNKQRKCINTSPPFYYICYLNKTINYKTKFTLKVYFFNKK